MKRIILAAFLSVSAICAPISYAYSDEECKDIMHIAKSLMKLRQDGWPMDNALNLVDEALGEAASKVPGDEARMKSVLRGVVLGAYDAPFWNRVEPIRTDYITQFGNKWMLKCMRGEI